MTGWLQQLASRGMARQFGTDDPAGLLAGYGWPAEFTDAARAYGRCSPEAVPEAVAADVAVVSRDYLVRGRRVPQTSSPPSVSEATNRPL
jgi:hypothetical protein